MVTRSKEWRKLVSLFLCFVVFSFFFLFSIYRMQPISFVNKTIKNDHPLVLYQFIIKLSKKIPSCASFIWMNTSYWVYNFVYKIIIEEQRLSLDSSFSSSILFQTRTAPNFLHATLRMSCSKVCVSVSTLKQLQRKHLVLLTQLRPYSISFWTDIKKQWAWLREYVRCRLYWP